jgi:GNAT superfamily N-acetyltransferase
MAQPLMLPLETLTGVRAQVRLAAPGRFEIVRLTDGAVAGELVLEAEGDAIVVRSLCVHEPYRSYGLGSETAALLVDAVTAARVPRLRAWAPPDRGLAVYFWSRMGLTPRHGPGPDGGIWFERITSSPLQTP